MRKYFRFSLRFMLVCVAILAAMLGREVNRARRQEETVRAIIRAGGHVIYDWDKVDVAGNRIDPGLARRLLGSHLFARVSSVHLSNAHVTDEILRPIGTLDGLLVLWVPGTQINGSGLRYLGGLQTLEALDLSETNISDDYIGELAQLKALTFLGLSDTRLTDRGLRKLGRLSALRDLALDDVSQFSDKALEDLHAALPQCYIQEL